MFIQILLTTTWTQSLPKAKSLTKEQSEHIIIGEVISICLSVS